MKTFYFSKAIPFITICILIVFDTFTALFGTSIAADIPHGIFIVFFSAIVYGAVLLLLWRKYHISPMRIGSVLVALSIMGFVLTVAIQHITPTLNILICILFGAGITVFCMNTILVLLVVHQYSLRYITPVSVFLFVSAMFVHYFLLETRRNNPTGLYSVYLIIVVSIGLLYFILKPYLSVDWHNKSRSCEDESPTAALVSKVDEDITRLNTYFIEKLTKRELQVAIEFMYGHNYKEIAEKLSISPHTVATHKKRIYDKLNVHNIAELIAAMRAVGQ
jgi:DNA-binding CsgD family transcriptional regulator